MNAYIEEQLRRAAESIEAGDFADALAELRPLDRYLVDDGRAWQLRGLAHFGLREYAEATDAFETASLLAPLTTQARIRLAQLYLRRRRRAAATAIYQHLATCETLSQAEAELVAAGLAAVEADAEAWTFCEARIRRFERSHKLAHLAAGALRRLGRSNDEVLGFVRRAFQLQPGDLTYRIALARCLLSVDRRPEAARLLSSVDLDATQCIPSLESMRILFERLGVADRAAHCRARLQAIAFVVSSGYRPTKHGF